MLSTLRNNAAGFFAKLLMALLILSFGVWGVEDMLKSGVASRSLGSVGKYEISRQTFERAYNREADKARQSLGKNYSPEMLQALGLGRQVLDSLITDELLRIESRNLGLLPGDEAVARAIRANPGFQNDKGEFDKRRFQATLANNNMSEKIYVEDMRQQMATNLLIATLTAQPAQNETMLNTLYAANSEQRVADLAILPLSLVKDEADPGDEKLAEFYKTRASAFAAPEYRTLSYISVSAEALTANVKIPETEVRKAYDERAKFFGDEKPEPFEKVRGAIEKEMKADKAEEAAAALSSQLQDLLAGGSTLAEAGKELHLAVNTVGPIDESGHSKNGEAAKLPEGFLDSAFKLEEGADSGLTKTASGYVLIRADKIDHSQSPPLSEVRGKVLAAWQHIERVKKLQAQSEEISRQLAAAKTAPEQAAVLAKYNVKFTTTGKLKRYATATSSNLTLPSTLVKDIFTLTPGQATKPYPSKDGTMMIAVLRERVTPPPVSKDTFAKDGEAKMFQARLLQADKEELLEGYLQYLRNKYHVKINEAAVAEYDAPRDR